MQMTPDPLFGWHARALTHVSPGQKKGRPKPPEHPLGDACGGCHLGGKVVLLLLETFPEHEA